MSPRHATFAAERAKLLFGCYRKAEANDPDVYAAAVTAVLAEFDADIIRHVTDPRTGLARTLKWLPSVAEVAEACEKEKSRRLYVELADKIRRERDQQPKQIEHRRTPESDARMRERFAELSSRLTIKRVPTASVIPPNDGKHGERVMADLARRSVCGNDQA